jgi:nucleotide-binding universal stress UspA family protein
MFEEKNISAKRTMKRLLAATDFSDHARNAAHRAALIAAEQQAHLELLHVISVSIVDVLRKLFPASAGANEKLVEEARGLLNALASDLSEKTGLRPTARVTVGRVLDEILSVSAQSDLVVLGARGLNLLRDLVLGSTAERLLSKSRLPMLVTKRPPQVPYQRVLVPVDFSDSSVRALRTAILVAPKADITVVHGCSVPVEGKLLWAGIADELVERYSDQVREEAERKITSLILDAGGDMQHFYREVKRSEASPLILAKEVLLGADLIAIGKHGQSMVEEWFLGSVTRHILSNSKCDVLVCP